MLTASVSRSRATIAATIAVTATRTVLTASTWVSSVRERIAHVIGRCAIKPDPVATRWSYTY